MPSIPFSCFEYSMETNKWQSYFLLGQIFRAILAQYTPLSPDIIRCNEKYGGQLPSVSCNAATARMPAEAKDTVHLGYNDVSFPQSQIAISKLSLYPDSFIEDTGIIDSMRSNRSKEDIVVSRIVITRVDCITYYTGTGEGVIGQA